MLTSSPTPMVSWTMIRLAIALFFVATTTAALADVRVIDGDTIDLDGTRIRLHGIDAPERKQPCYRNGIMWLCGQEATKHLKDFLRDRTVRCDIRGKDRYGRSIGVCFAGNVNINRYMVVSGFAMAYWRYSHDYVEWEIEARRAKRGIWSGRFTPPWDWRRGKM